jgi:3'-phosphoadenosine 5'-phosphosulfate sulfotransferase (PAPS reductase)/FAD synthetase
MGVIINNKCEGSMEHNIISVSGGKDSTALLLLAIERSTENMQAVFADTGNEHQQTYDYVQYLSENVFPIRRVVADFSQQIEGKRQYVLTKWAEKGVSQADIDRAAAALVPTGNPFLDLCIWKGRFPSSKAAFCSEELKRNPIIRQVQNPLLDAGDDVVSWQGVRRDESLRRSTLPERELKLRREDTGAELWNYRPILDWTAADVFAMHDKRGAMKNPLYSQGMGRVGCMPCINCRKDELLEISRRFPEAIERIRMWEDAVKNASKRQAATFFAAPSDDNEWSAQQTIDRRVEWAKTSRGGQQYDLLRVFDDAPLCSSIYGLCE